MDMKKLTLLIFTLLLFCYNQVSAQDDDSFVLTSNAIAIGEFSGDKPKFDGRRMENTDILFQKNLIKIDNKGQTTLKLRNKTNYSKDNSVAFRYDATDNFGKECVVMFEVYADGSVLNIYYQEMIVYVRYYIVNKN